MRRPSLLVILIAAIVLAYIRLSLARWETPTVTATLTWDAFGYYLYLPGKFIYHDLTKLEWLPQIIEQYSPTGKLYQVCPLPNGNFAMKYLMGLSILYAPFFFLGHWAAGILGYPQDGFSAPYQLSICLGAWVYAVAGLLLLRTVLRKFFSEGVTALTLALIALASNYPQYVAGDSGMTHGFLFTVYVFALYAAWKWHEAPSKMWAFAIGWVLGLAAITRPTEGVMLFVPLLWQWKRVDLAPSKWIFFRQKPMYLVLAAAGFFGGILPQLLYWKSVTGHWLFDVGSKFLFLNPHWQVLFGWEKGWFIYTPVAVLMTAGLLFQRGFPFKKAVLVFVWLNTWIILAWSDWRYGATYSCRALVQSYAVLALPLAALLQRFWAGWRKVAWLATGVFLIVLNLFQIWQYNRTILHFNDMNPAYYRAIFLNPDPSPIDMSLLDTDERPQHEKDYEARTLFSRDSVARIHVNKQARADFVDTLLSAWPELASKQDQWLKISAEVTSDWGAFETWLTTELVQGEQKKRTACRMHNGICRLKDWNTIRYYFKAPPGYTGGRLRVFAETAIDQDIYIRNVRVEWMAAK